MSGMRVSVLWIDMYYYSELTEAFRGLKKSEPIKYKAIQTIFKGNNTAMRTHVSRAGMGHYNIYRDKCVKLGIAMDERCIPKEEAQRLSGMKSANGLERYVFGHSVCRFTDCQFSSQSSILDYSTCIVKPSAEWMKSGLDDKIVRFILETDQVYN
jgi:hypothetical protein